MKYGLGISRTAVFIWGKTQHRANLDGLKFAFLELMRRLVLTILILTICPTAGAGHKRRIGSAITVENNPWSMVQTPAPGEAKVIGFYADGCLQGAERLSDGPGYKIMHRERNRFYAHPDMIDFVHYLGSYAATNENGENLLVGDLAMIRGGPTLSRHASHQTGLDGDFWFKLWSRNEPIPTDSALMVNWLYLKARFQDELRKKNRKVFFDTKLILSALSPEWGGSQERILKEATLNPRVERIFVDPVIKKKFCVTYPDDKEMLMKLRPAWGHWDHFHVRLACPVGDSLCKKQPAVEGDGCNDGELEREFFSKIVLPPEPGQPLPKHEMPKLPYECKAVLLAK